MSAVGISSAPAPAARTRRSRMSPVVMLSAGFLVVVVLVIALVVMAGQLVCGNPEVVLK